jgi:hypothetical protein
MNYRFKRCSMKYFLPVIGCLLIVLTARTQEICRSFDYRQQQLRLHPGLAAELAAVEQFTQGQLQPSRVAVTGEGVPASTLSLITIPVVVHVIYNTPAQNISAAQIQSEITVLNRDYQKLNADTAEIPSYYSVFAANCGFRFVLATIDTNGNPTTGIVRVHTNVTAFTINDAMKSPATGGDDPWDRDRYLNIYVCNLEPGVLGYSSLVGGPKETDGAVVLYTAFGTVGTATAPFNLGRTCTHEVGHWLNMIHTWGDDSCGNDQVADTPPQEVADYGDPSGIILSCNNGPYGNMYMNYMDFTNDMGMHMFTYGQMARMRTLFDSGGFRRPLLYSPAALAADTMAGLGATLAAGGHPELYPNPAAGMVTVNLTDPAEVGGLLEVYNQVGQRMMVMRVTQQNFQLNVSSFAGGVYFIRVTGGSDRNTLKLVKL